MTIDITGITNENEFYTHHYLSAILENDLKDVFSEWKRQEDEEKIPQPYARLRGLRKEYFATYTLLEKEKNVGERLRIQREFIATLLDSLGYQYHFQIMELDDEGSIPLIGGVVKSDGSPELWIIEALNSYDEDVDPLELTLFEEQYGFQGDNVKPVLVPPIEEIITRQVFGRTEPPRWVILLSFSQLLLLDRSKWHEKRLLRFDLREILDRREITTLQATTALLHKDSICPGDGIPLLDTLDENSHKHAFAVSEDLKYSLRKAIELLGNEAVYYLQEKLHQKVYGKDMAGQLTRECLRYMYRLLFLFYIEARPELGYLPNKSEQYRKGYSLESLRDLEMIQLHTEESKNRFFLHESIKILYQLLYEGDPINRQLSIDKVTSGGVDTFTIAPLRSHLFDPKQTPLLNKVKFRNFILQEVIQLMSLSRSGRGRNTRRGRISYAQLGINQLGAVYEALLSYQGFFAETDLYEVKKAGEQHNELETAYFVKPEDIEQYAENEQVFNDDGSLVMYRKGTFIYRLAGRDREKSASYYTPEVLTKCLVKYALKELLKDKTAGEILELTVCEPAMGSAAFLNEAVNQLAKAYLDLKQKETGQTITHDEYPKELQQVKMYIADNNVYGVDLNPVAVELAEVSLWLNTIYEGAFVPWFGMQLVCGNSLIGARRQVFSSKLLKKEKKSDPLWLDEVPIRVMPGEEREADTVYHFLLPDKGMADYKDKVIKEMAEEEIKAINEWRKDFTQPFSKSEIEQLKKLSAAVDKLWKKHAEMQRNIDDRTTDPLQVFGQPKPEEKLRLSTTEDKDRILQQELFSKNVRNSSPYRRLKLVMDYWCALWFWPIEKAETLPSRAEYLFDLTLLLEGNLYDSGAEEKGPRLLFPDTRPKQQSLTMIDEFGYVNVDKLCHENVRLGLVQKIADRYQYLHWELEFANLFNSRGGFDLVLGNPPWIKIEWNEGNVLGDTEPLFVLRKYSASKLADLRRSLLSNKKVFQNFIENYEEAESTQGFLNSKQMYPSLLGMKTNLYKCFMPIGWSFSSEYGRVAYIHDQGVFDDARGGEFRSECYKRLVLLFKFQNEKELFKDVGHAKKFELSLFGKEKQETGFFVIANVYHPSTIDKCFQSNGEGKTPGIKGADGGWNLAGHKNRIIYVDKSMLSLFVDLFDSQETPTLEARIPAVHSIEMMEVLRKISNYPKQVGSLNNSVFFTEMYDETGAQKRGEIIRDTIFVNSPEKLIFSGPHFNVANPLYQTPRSVCDTHHAYDVIDLKSISADYLPRSNYIPVKELRGQSRSLQAVPWSKQIVTEYYRIAFRRRLNPSQERTLIACLIPQKTGHIHPVLSCAAETNDSLLRIGAFSFSILGDFYIKTTGKLDLYGATIKLFPLIKNNNDIACRALILNCLSGYYKELWENCYSNSFNTIKWAKSDMRLNNSFFARLNSKWELGFGIRNDYCRRQVLIELDVLVARQLNLTVEELKTIFRIQFPITKQYEEDTWYDNSGTIVFTTNKSLAGIGFPRKSSKDNPIGWEDIKDMQSGTVERTIIDNTMPGGPVERTITYEAPFDRCDREKDYEVVWAEFEKRFQGK